jgi:hypothetical protein
MYLMGYTKSPISALLFRYNLDMDRDNVFRRNGVNIFRVDKVHNLKIENYINPEFELKIHPGGLSETGLLSIFEISPKDEESMFPTFVARWDQNKETLDIDLKNTSPDELELFKSEKVGYSGHHPIRLNTPSRTFKVDIRTPSHHIFTGNVSFNINHGHEPGLFQ